ncbi:hypothetical protein [Streptomyces sp. NRRL S-244]|uniref:hypothetical protein n=1 Tax=Streptomyces sp. NRRL S-244 TaxID=1463897 RepID=UPI00068BFD61|nr:hypothetical protein [Streptomyces sp. NRRL S-244]
MGTLLGELGKKLAERWLSLLVLPGVLYLAVAALARTLGQAHPFAVGRLAGQVTAWAGAPAARTVGGQVVVLAAVLVGAAAVGVVAQALGSAVERVQLAADWPSWPAPARGLAYRITVRRRRRWRTAAETWHRHREQAAAARTRGERADPTGRLAARAAMVRISAEHPDRPTWSGDRIHAAAVRVDRDHRLDLAALWPHLWLVLPDTARAEVTAARQALSRATTLTAWALLYLPLALWWWPAAAIAVVLALAGRHRTRSAADTYATLLEAATRLQARDLAGPLGLDPTGPLTREAGATLGLHLAPSPPPRPYDGGP